MATALPHHATLQDRAVQLSHQLRLLYTGGFLITGSAELISDTVLQISPHPLPRPQSGTRKIQARFPGVTNPSTSEAHISPDPAH